MNHPFRDQNPYEPPVRAELAHPSQPTQPSKFKTVARDFIRTTIVAIFLAPIAYLLSPVLLAGLGVIYCIICLLAVWKLAS